MIIVTTPPAGEPVSPAELKAQLRVTTELEDDLVAALLVAAVQRLEAELGARVLVTGLRETVAAPAAVATLSIGPVVGVDAVAAQSPDGSWTALDASGWRADGDRPGRVTLPRAGVARVDYRAGFAADPASVPPALKQAILALAADGYERRADPAAPAPPGLGAAETWAAPFRRVRL